MEKISLCVPTYNRPETLKTLIKTFLKQDYSNKELVISDDTPNDSIEKLVKGDKNKSIKYFHNKKALGFSKNYLAALLRGTGDYLITIGDDDILFTKNVLSIYVKKFQQNPKVFYLYSNLVQFSDKMKVEYIINTYKKDSYFRRGEEAMKGVWTSSIFIGGIGIRNKISLEKFYPEKKILHPQVQLIGNIINQHDAYVISDNLIGIRSHNDQIIFRALKNKKIRQEGQHMTIELFNIFNYLKKKYNLSLSFNFIAQQLIQLQMIMIFKEKMNLGNTQMQKNYREFCNISETARSSLKLKFGVLLAKILPSFAISTFRNTALKLVMLRNRSAYDRFSHQLKSITLNK